MSYVKKLRIVLREKDQNLYERLMQIEPLARKVLTYTAGAFPFYTPHDFAHSENVEENLNWIIPEPVKQEMNPFEVFFLALAAWLHDWGMVCRPQEAPEQARHDHHVRAEQNFEEMHHLLNLTLHEARIVGRISRGHRKEDLRSPLYDEQIYGANVHIDVRFLAALLRLADECDVTHNRVPELIYYSLSPRGASEEHFRAHLAIQGIGKSSQLGTQDTDSGGRVRPQGSRDTSETEGEDSEGGGSCQGNSG